MKSKQSSPPAGSSLSTTIAAAVAGFVILKFLGPRHETSVSKASTQRRPQALADRELGKKKQASVDQTAPEIDRGQHADSPVEIPPTGWRDILVRTYKEFGDDRVMAIAAGVTYYALLAIFPAIAALVSVYGLFSDPATIQDHLNSLVGILPGGALEIIGDQVKRISSQEPATLGISFIVGVVIAIWSANAGMKAIFDALNVVYDEEEKRSFIKLNLVSLTFTGAALAFVLLAIAGIVVLPIALEFVGLGSGVEWLLRLGRWPILLICVVAGLAVLYRYGPSRELAKWRWVTPGGIIAAVLWVAVSILFSWYVANFGSYNETYGSLGAVIGFMTWIWASAIVVLLGAEVNSEAEHQTRNDSPADPQRST